MINGKPVHVKGYTRKGSMTDITKKTAGAKRVVRQLKTHISRGRPNPLQDSVEAAAGKAWRRGTGGGGEKAIETRFGAEAGRALKKSYRSGGSDFQTEFGGGHGNSGKDSGDMRLMQMLAKGSKHPDFVRARKKEKALRNLDLKFNKESSAKAEELGMIDTSKAMLAAQAQSKSGVGKYIPDNKLTAARLKGSLGGALKGTVTGALGGGTVGAIGSKLLKKKGPTGTLAGATIGGFLGQEFGGAMGQFKADKKYFAEKGINLRYGGMRSTITPEARKKYLPKKKKKTAAERTRLKNTLNGGLTGSVVGSTAGALGGLGFDLGMRALAKATHQPTGGLMSTRMHTAAGAALGSVTGGGIGLTAGALKKLKKKEKTAGLPRYLREAVKAGRKFPKGSPQAKAIEKNLVGKQKHTQDWFKKNREDLSDAIMDNKGSLKGANKVQSDRRSMQQLLGGSGEYGGSGKDGPRPIFKRNKTQKVRRRKIDSQVEGKLRDADRTNYRAHIDVGASTEGLGYKPGRRVRAWKAERIKKKKRREALQDTAAIVGGTAAGVGAAALTGRHISKKRKEKTAGLPRALKNALKSGKPFPIGSPQAEAIKKYKAGKNPITKAWFKGNRERQEVLDKAHRASPPGVAKMDILDRKEFNNIKRRTYARSLGGSGKKSDRVKKFHWAEKKQSRANKGDIAKEQSAIDGSVKNRLRRRWRDKADFGHYLPESYGPRSYTPPKKGVKASKARNAKREQEWQAKETASKASMDARDKARNKRRTLGAAAAALGIGGAGYGVHKYNKSKKKEKTAGLPRALKNALKNVKTFPKGSFQDKAIRKHIGGSGPTGRMLKDDREVAEIIARKQRTMEGQYGNARHELTQKAEAIRRVRESAGKALGGSGNPSVRSGKKVRGSTDINTWEGESRRGARKKWHERAGSGDTSDVMHRGEHYMPPKKALRGIERLKRRAKWSRRKGTK